MMKDDQSPVFEPLEPRILLSATPVEDNNQEVVSTTITDEVKQETNLTLLIVDSQVESYQSLLKEIDSQIIIEFLEPSKDGVEQISSILSKYNNLSSLHILSHGSDSSISLGNSTLNQTSLSSYSSSLSQWKNSFKTGGDVLFYGCNIAKTKSFINELSSIISLDVAASDDLTGATSKNADAILEYNQGQIESKSLFSQQTFNSHVTLLAENNIDSSFFTVEDIDTTEDESTDLTLPITLGERYTVGGSRADVYNERSFNSNTGDNISFLRRGDNDSLSIRFYLTSSNSVDNSVASFEERIGQVDIQINNKDNTISASYNDYDNDSDNYSFVSKTIADDNVFYNLIDDVVGGKSIGSKGSKFFQFKRNGDNYILKFRSSNSMKVVGQVEYSSAEINSLKRLSSQSKTLIGTFQNFDFDQDTDVMFLDFAGSTRAFDDSTDENQTGGKITIRRYADGKLYANGIMTGSYGTDGGGGNHSFNYYFEDYEIKTAPDHSSIDRILTGASKTSGDRAANLLLNYKLYINSTNGKFQIWGNLNSGTDNNRKTQSAVVVEQYKRTGAGSVAVELTPSIVEYQNDRLDGETIHYRYRISVGAEQGTIKLAGFNAAVNHANQNKEFATVNLDLLNNEASGYYFVARASSPVMGAYNTVALQDTFVSLSGNTSTTNQGSVEALQIKKGSDSQGEYIELVSTTNLTQYHARPDNSVATWQGLEPLRLKNWGSTKFIGQGFVEQADGSYLVSARDMINNIKLTLEPPDNYNGSYTIRGEIQLGSDDSVSSFVNINVASVQDNIKLKSETSQNVATIYTVQELLSFSTTDPKANNNNIAISSFDATHGAWQFSIDGGTTFQNISGVSINNALLLSNSDLIRFSHVADEYDFATIGIYAWDGSGGFSSGDMIDLENESSFTNPNPNIFSEASDLVSIEVFKDNRPPTIAPNIINPIEFTEGDPVVDIADTVVIGDMDGNQIVSLIFDVLGFSKGDIFTLSGEDFEYGVVSTKKIMIGSTDYDAIYDGKEKISIDASSNVIELTDANAFVNTLKYSNISDDSSSDERLVYLTVVDNHVTETATTRTAISQINFTTVNDAPIIARYEDQIVDEVIASAKGTVKVMHRDAILSLVEQDDLAKNIIINITNVQDINKEFLKIEGKDIDITVNDLTTLTTETDMNLKVEYDAATGISQVTISSTAGVDVSRINSMLSAMLYFNTSASPTIGNANKRVISLGIQDNGGVENGGNDTSDGDTLTAGNQLYQIKSITLNNDDAVSLDLNGASTSGTTYNTTYIENSSAEAINQADVIVPAGSMVRYLDLDLNQFQKSDKDTLIIDGKDIVFGTATSVSVAHGGSLTYNGGTSITIDWGMSGIDESQIQSFLRNIQFRFDGKSPIIISRLISQGIETTSGQFASRQSTINVEERDSAPEIVLANTQVSYQENSSAVNLFDEVVVDVFEDSQTIFGFDFVMNNLENGGEGEFINIWGTSYELNTDSVIEIENLSGTKVGVFEIFNTGNSVDFIFTFDDPSILPEPSMFQSLLRSMTYHSTKDTFTNLSRIIEFTLLQDSGDNTNGHENTADLIANPVTLTINILPVNDEPTISNGASITEINYTEGESAKGIFGSLVLDNDNDVTTSLSLVIANVVTGDLLSVNGTDIALDVISASQTITLANGDDIALEVTAAGTVIVTGDSFAVNAFDDEVSFVGVDEATEVTSSKTFTAKEQQVKASLSITNILDAGFEFVEIDGSTISLTTDATTTTATSNLQVIVSYTGTTATLAIAGNQDSFLSKSDLLAALNGIKYVNTRPNKISKTTKTITGFITDSGRNNSLDDAVGSTVTIGSIIINTVNDEPTIINDVSDINTNYTEEETAKSIFGSLKIDTIDPNVITTLNLSFTNLTSGDKLTINGVDIDLNTVASSQEITLDNQQIVSLEVTSAGEVQVIGRSDLVDKFEDDVIFTLADTNANVDSSETYIESAQKVKAVLTIDNIVDTDAEKLTIDGTEFDISKAVTETETTNAKVEVAFSGTTATITILGKSADFLEVSVLETLLNGIKYTNTSDDITKNIKTVKAQITDDGDNTSPSDAVGEETIIGTISTDVINDQPTIENTATSTKTSYTEGDGETEIFGSLAIDAIDRNVTKATLNLNISNVIAGDKITVNANDISLDASASVQTYTLASGEEIEVEITFATDTAVVLISGSEEAINEFETNAVYSGVDEATEVETTKTFTQTEQKVKAVLTIDNIVDGDAEKLTIDGTEFDISKAVTETETTNAKVEVAFSSGTATITILGKSADFLEVSVLETLLNGIKYTNTSEDVTENTKTLKAVITDDGSNTSPNDAIGTETTLGTIEITAVNDEPTIENTATDTKTSYTEGDSATEIFGSLEVDTIEAGQKVKAVLTIDNIVDTDAEKLTIDGTEFDISKAVTETETTNAKVEVAFSGTTATITILGKSADFLEVSVLETLLNGIKYTNTSEDVTENTKTLKAVITDDGSNTSPNDAIGTETTLGTIEITAVNDEPTIENKATDTKTSYTEGDSATEIFGSLEVDTIEAGQKVKAVLTIDNIVDGDAEKLTIDGTEFDISKAVTETETTNAKVEVAFSSGTATITIVGKSADFLEVSVLETLLNGIKYTNTSEDVTENTKTLKAVITDDGSNTSPNDAIGTETTLGTIEITAVNDEPTIENTATDTKTSYTEGDSATEIFGSLEVDTVESGQKVKAVLTIDNIVDTDAEKLTIDGTEFDISKAVTETETTNAKVEVAFSSGTATITILGKSADFLEVSVLETLLNGIKYSNTSEDVTENTKTLKAVITDDGSNTSPNDAIGTETTLGTIEITAVNDEPTIENTATDTKTSYTEGDSATEIFGSLEVDTVEAGQKVKAVLTIDNIVDGDAEKLTIDGTEFDISKAVTETETTNAKVEVAFSSGTATITILGKSADFLEVSVLETLLNGIKYTNTSEDVTENTKTLKAVITDDGSNTSPNDAIGTETTLGTIEITAVNDEPTIENTATDTKTSYTEGDSATEIFGSLEVDTIEAGQKVKAVLTIDNIVDTDAEKLTIDGTEFDISKAVTETETTNAKVEVAFSSGTATITILGKSADFLEVSVLETLLNGIKYTNTSEDVTENTKTLKAVITDDGSNTSPNDAIGTETTLGTIEITAVNDEPTIENTATDTKTSYTEGDSATEIFGSLEVDTVESGQKVKAVLTIDNIVDTDAEKLTIDGTEFDISKAVTETETTNAKVEVAFSSGTATITILGKSADFLEVSVLETLLNGIKYTNTSEDVTENTKTLKAVITDDGSNTSPNDAIGTETTLGTIEITAVNDEPTIENTATDTKTSYTEGDSATEIFGSLEVDTIEAGQKVKAVLTIDNIVDGDAEKLTIDGTEFDISKAVTETETTNAKVEVAFSSGVATITILGKSADFLEVSVLETLLNGIKYTNTSEDVTENTKTLKAVITDDGSNTSPNDAIGTETTLGTIEITAVNDEPTIENTATDTKTSYTEGDSATEIFGSLELDTIEAGQKVKAVLTIDNIVDGDAEKLTIDGTEFDISKAVTETETTNAKVEVAFNSGTATITILGKSADFLEVSVLETLLNGIKYTNTSEDVTENTKTLKAVITDDGSNTSPNDAIGTETTLGTIEITAINDEPTIENTATDTKTSYTEGDSATEIFGSLEVDTIEAGQKVKAVLTIDNIVDGDAEKLTIDGTEFDISKAVTETETTNAKVEVAFNSGTATITILGKSADFLEVSVLETLLNGIKYTNTSEDVTENTKTLKAVITDDGSNTSPNDAIGTETTLGTIEITAVNDEPTIENKATDTKTSYTEGDSATEIFGSLEVDTIEAGQKVKAVLTIDNIVDGDAEKLTIDGTEFDISKAVTETETTNAKVEVAFSSGTATITILGKSADFLEVSVLETLLNGIKYTNTSEDVTENTKTLKAVITDDGSNTSPNDAIGTETTLGTIEITAVNDEPTIENTATDTKTSYTEGDSATEIFGSLEVDTVEAGQKVKAVLTIDNIVDTDAEKLTIDGTEFDISKAVTETETTNAKVEVAFSSGTATITILGKSADFLEVSVLETLLNGIKYTNTSEDVTENTKTLKAVITDDGSNTSPNDAIGTETTLGTIEITAVNDEPTIENTATDTKTSYTEGDSATEIFGSLEVDTIEAGQKVKAVLTIDNIVDTDAEKLTIDGTEFDISKAVTETETTNAKVEVAFSSGTATITILGKSADFLEVSVLETLLNGIKYTNTSEDVTENTKTLKAVITDDGSNTSPNDAIGTETTLGTIEITAVNDEPTISNTASVTNTSYTEGDGATEIFGSLEVDTIEAGQKVKAVLTIDNIVDGDAEKLTIDGTEFDISKAVTETETTNAKVEVAFSSGTATITIIGKSADFLEVSVLETLLNGIKYSNTNQDITKNIKTLKAVITDDGSNTSPNDAIGSETELGTISTTAVNEQPIITNGAVDTKTSYTERDSATELFGSLEVDTIEASQKVKAVLTIDNIVDTDAEKLTIDGTEFDISKAVTETETTNAKVEVAFSGTTATITIIGKSADFLEVSVLETLLNGIKYTNTSDDITKNIKTVKAQITDDGDNTSPSDAVGEETIIGTISTDVINDQPTIENTATSTKTSYTEGDGETEIFGSLAIDAIDRNVTKATLNLNISNVIAGDKITVNANDISLDASASVQTYTLASGEEIEVEITFATDTAVVLISGSEDAINEFETNAVYSGVDEATEVETTKTFTQTEQKVKAVLTIDNIVDGDAEKLTIDGTEFDISKAVTETETTNAKVEVAFSGTTATITILGKSADFLEVSVLETLLNGIKYTNTSEDVTENTKTLKAVITDDGSNTSPNDAIGTETTLGTIEITAVNDEPTIENTATDTKTSYTEGDSATEIFGSLEVDTIEAGQKVKAVLTIDNIVDGDAEKLTIDGTEFDISKAVTETETTNAKVEVAFSSGTATITILGKSADFLEVSVLETLLNGIKYTNTNQDVTENTKTLKAVITDDGSNTSPNDAIGEETTLGTIEITAVNDEPTIENTATDTKTSYTEGDSATEIFGSLEVDTIEAGQKVKAVLTIDNIVDTDAEKLTIDGTEFDISKAVTETETTNAKVEVAFSSGTATITILGKSADFLEVSVLETLLNGIKYTNTSEDVTENTKTLKAVITDDGSNTSPNDAIGTETTLGTIEITAVNDEPTIENTATDTKTSYTEGDSATEIFGSLEVDTIEAGQKVKAVLTIDNIVDGDAEKLTIDGTEFDISKAVTETETTNAKVEVAFSSGTATITILGKSADFLEVSVLETLLNGIKYTNTSEDVTENTKTLKAVITDDGSNTSPNDAIGTETTLGTIEITAVNDEPTIENTATDTKTSYTEGDSATEIFGSLEVDTIEAGQKVKAVLTIDNIVDTDAEKLTIDGTEFDISKAVTETETTNAKVEVAFSSGTATITILGKSADFLEVSVLETLLNGIKYTNTSEDVTENTKTLKAVITDDGSNTSPNDAIGTETTLGTIEITAVNDEPTIENTATDTKTSYTEGDSATEIFGSLEVDIVEASQKVKAVLTIDNIVDGDAEKLTIDGTEFDISKAVTETETTNAKVEVAFSSGTATITILGKSADFLEVSVLETLLNGIKYTNTSEDVTENTKTLKAVITDDGSNASPNDAIGTETTLGTIEITAVNDEPTIENTATDTKTSYTEGDSATEIFGSLEVDTIEAGQKVKAVLTIDNIVDTDAEKLTIDGTEFDISKAVTETETTNAKVEVAFSSGTATITIVGKSADFLEVSVLETLLNGIKYTNTNQDVTENTKTLKAVITDDGSNTSPNDAIGEETTLGTIEITAVNDEPTIENTATDTKTSYTEGDSATEIFGSLEVDTIEAGQKVKAVLTIDNIVDGDAEKLTIDGTEFDISKAVTETETTNAKVEVAFSSGTATITILGKSADFLEVSVLETLLNGIKYSNTSNKVTENTKTIKVTITDDGDNTGSNDAVGVATTIGEINTVTVNSDPTFGPQDPLKLKPNGSYGKIIADDEDGDLTYEITDIVGPAVTDEDGNEIPLDEVFIIDEETGEITINPKVSLEEINGKDFKVTVTVTDDSGSSIFEEFDFSSAIPKLNKEGKDTLKLDEGSPKTSFEIPTPTDEDDDTLTTYITKLPAADEGKIFYKGEELIPIYDADGKLLEIQTTSGEVISSVEDGIGIAVEDLSKFEFIPVEDFVGTTTLEYGVSDGITLVEGSFNFDVNKIPTFGTQDPLVLKPDGTLGKINVDDDGDLTYEITDVVGPAVTDEDGNEIPANEIFIIDEETGEVTINPKVSLEKINGNDYKIKVNVTDDSGISISEEFDFSSAIPELNNEGKDTLKLDEGSPKTSFEIPTPTDEDDDTLTTYITKLPAADEGKIFYKGEELIPIYDADGKLLEIQTISGKVISSISDGIGVSVEDLSKFEFISTEEFLGTTTLEYGVSDGITLVEGSFNFDVNQIPTFGTQDPLKLNPDDTSVGQVKAEDDGKLTYEITDVIGPVVTDENGNKVSADEIFIIDEETGEITINPKVSLEEINGKEFTIKVTIIDEEGTKISKEFSLTSSLPKLNANDGNSSDLKLGSKEEKFVIPTPTDADGDELTTYITKLPTSNEGKIFYKGEELVPIYDEEGNLIEIQTTSGEVISSTIDGIGISVEDLDKFEFRPANGFSGVAEFGYGVSDGISIIEGSYYFNVPKFIPALIPSTPSESISDERNSLSNSSDDNNTNSSDNSLGTSSDGLLNSSSEFSFSTSNAELDPTPFDSTLQNVEFSEFNINTNLSIKVEAIDRLSIFSFVSRVQKPESFGTSISRLGLSNSINVDLVSADRLKIDLQEVFRKSYLNEAEKLFLKNSGVDEVIFEDDNNNDTENKQNDTSLSQNDLDFITSLNEQILDDFRIDA